MSLFEEFQEFRKILCICPCCGDIVRVSDLKLKAKGSTTSTWLDTHEKNRRAIEGKEERFEEIREELRIRAREKGRKEADNAFNKAISPKIKALKLNPHDIEAILHPIDYIAFKGMTAKDTISEILLLTQQSKNPALQALRDQVKKTIQTRSYEWKTARIDDKWNIEIEE
jgi:predicted Holliday junction resolvase-like endonuclease